MEETTLNPQTLVAVKPELGARVRELLGLDPSDRDLEVTAPRAEVLDMIAQQWQADGLRICRFDAPISALPSTLTSVRPLLTLTEAAEPCLVVGYQGQRFCIEDTHGHRAWMTAKDLATHLGIRLRDVEQPWVSLERAKDMVLPLSPTVSPWRNAFALLDGEQSTIGAVVLYAIGIAVFSLAIPLTVQAVVNTIAFGQLVQPLFVLTIGLLVGLLIAGALRATQAWVIEILQRRLLVKFVSQLADRLPRMQHVVFERGEGPELVNRFFDIFIAQKSVAALLLGGIESALMTIVGLLVLSFYHPALLAFGIALLGAFGLIFWLLGIRGTSTAVAESKSKFALAAGLEELTRHLFLLKSPNSRRASQHHLDRLTTAWLRHRSDHYRVYFRQLVSGIGVQAVAHAALLAIGGWLVIQRSLTLGQLVAAELIVASVVAALARLVGKIEAAYDLAASADKLASLLALPLENPRDIERVGVSTDGPALVEFRNLSLQEQGIEDFSCVVQRTTVVGISAAHHSARALGDLIYGFAESDRGHICINGHDTADLELDELRELVALVRREEVLPGTIEANLTVQGKKESASRLWSILEQVGLSDIVRGLPDRLHTVLAPSGAPLERTDALKLTLARSLLNNPGVLVLDGFLEYLPESIRASLLQAIRIGRTVIVLSAEENVLALCDEVCRLPQQPRGGRA